LLFAALLFAGGIAWAGQVAGTVTNLSGALLAKKADGTMKILGLKSEVESGDTLVAEKNTYAQLKLIDNSEITLKPNTTFKIEQFDYDEGKPAGDNAVFSLLKGGLRSVTGLLGKRNKEKFALKTPTATIGIRGTTFIADYIEPSPEAVAAQLAYVYASSAGLGAGSGAGAVALPLPPGPVPGAPTPTPSLPPGLYVQVLDGLINVSNRGGTASFAAGQFGYTANPGQPPVVVPKNPGIQFTPPPIFNSSSSTNTTSSSSGKSNTVDCEVR
jgi:hypothetical protein